jgi:hypothetical protein
LGDFWERRIEDVLLDSIAENTRNGLHDYLPSVLSRSLVKMSDMSDRECGARRR